MSDQNYTPRQVQSVKRLEYSVRIYFRFWSLWSKCIRLILVLDFRYETHVLHNTSFLNIVPSHHKVLRKLEPRKARNTTKQSSNISGIGLNRTQRAKSAHSFAFPPSLRSRSCPSNFANGCRNSRPFHSILALYSLSLSFQSTFVSGLKCTLWAESFVEKLAGGSTRAWFEWWVRTDSSSLREERGLWFETSIYMM